MEPMGEVNGSPDDIYRGGTIGSMGGGSVFGSISIGGAGGWSSGALIDNANIRTGSNISGNYVTLKITRLSGGKGGNGGSKAGGSAALFSGASVLRGISIGGGILSEILALVDEEEFRQNFIHKHPHKKCLKKSLILSSPIPVRGFVTMESFVHHPKRFMLDKEGRFLF